MEQRVSCRVRQRLRLLDLQGQSSLAVCTGAHILQCCNTTQTKRFRNSTSAGKRAWYLTNIKHNAHSNTCRKIGSIHGSSLSCAPCGAGVPVCLCGIADD